MKAKEKIIEGSKTVGYLICGGGAEMFINGICRAILPPGVNAIVKGGVLLGGLLVGGCLGNVLSADLNKSIDETVEFCDDTISEIKRCVDVIQDKDEKEE